MAQSGARVVSHDNASALLAVLRAQIGVTEHPLGSNDGPEVRRYLLAAGAHPGDPWCAALQHWAMAQIGQPGHGAYCPTWFPAKRRVSAEAVRPGDQLGIVFKSLGRIAHIGTVERVERRQVYTIEGNTNAQGSREGDRCARRIPRPRPGRLRALAAALIFMSALPIPKPGRHVNFVLHEGQNAGQIRTAIITRVWRSEGDGLPACTQPGETVQLTVFLDGSNDILRAEGGHETLLAVSSAAYDPKGTKPRTWHWPVRDNAHAPKGAINAAIQTLTVARDVLATNEPINRREGKIEQADLEARELQEIGRALKILPQIEALREKALALCHQIEVCGASPALTLASQMASELRQALSA